MSTVMQDTPAAGAVSAELVLDEQLVDRCTVRDHYGVRLFVVPSLPSSPYVCPRCDGPLWSEGAQCRGRGAELSHPSAGVVARGRVPA